VPNVALEPNIISLSGANSLIARSIALVKSSVSVTCVPSAES
jgi:hypothetical protein